MSIIRYSHVLPGADLPPQPRARIRRMAVAADAFQVVCGVAAGLLPAYVSQRHLSDEQLLLILAVIMLFNVSFNIFIRVKVRDAERVVDAELESAARGGDKQAAREHARRGTLGRAAAGDDLTLHAVTHTAHGHRGRDVASLAAAAAARTRTTSSATAESGGGGGGGGVGDQGQQVDQGRRRRVRSVFAN